MNTSLIIFKDTKSQIVLWVSVISGLTASFISGYVEFYFLQGILNSSYTLSLFIAMVLESAKLVAIILHRFMQKQRTNYSILSESIIFVNRITRVSLVIFSVICCFSKISEYMESPLLEKKWETKKKEIDTWYTKEINTTDSTYKIRIQGIQKNIDSLTIVDDTEFMSKNFPKVKDRYDFYRLRRVDKQMSERREGTLKNLTNAYNLSVRSRDSIIEDKKLAWNTSIEAAYSELRNSLEVQPPLVVGIYTVIQNTGLKFNFKPFLAIFVILVAGFLTIILELIIFNTFNYLVSIYILYIYRDEYTQNTYIP